MAVQTEIEKRIEKMLDRYTKGGGNRTDGLNRLNEILNTASKNFMPHALIYNGFATEKQAEMFTELWGEN